MVEIFTEPNQPAFASAPTIPTQSTTSTNTQHHSYPWTPHYAHILRQKLNDQDSYDKSRGTSSSQQHQQSYNNRSNSRASSPALSTRSSTRHTRRPLSIASTISIDSNMSSEHLPSSPPELSRCSSAKSSSFRSMPSQEDMNDMANFEDISLSDQFSSYPSKPRPTLRSAQTTTAATPRRSSSSTNLWGSNGLRIVASNNHARSRNSWQPEPLSSSPVIAQYGRRTPSPSKSPITSSSPVSDTSSTPRLGTSKSPMLSPVSRRQSWQQRPRKTAKELEQDYDDFDDELPEDSILFNIPLSPRPLHARSPNTPLPRHPSEHRLSRTTSWKVALGDLEEDTRKLTAALENHADIKLEEEASAESPASDASTPKSRLALTRTKTAPILPPVQKPNPLVDPLPCSQEKEKCLSRTRPSWLPPKSRQEEKKHLKEYEKMMRQFIVSGGQVV